MKSLVSLVDKVTELIREKKWGELICFILAVIIVGWVSREPIKSIFKIKEYPQWFVWGCLGGILLFCVAVLIKVFNKQGQGQELPPQLAIKGLRPFTQKDAEVFSKLQRNKSINACLSMLQDREFRIGILWGESGCGKSSFIQAGLMPKLTTEESQYRGIYIKFSDKNPLETVKKEIIRSLKLNSQETEKLDFLVVCEQGIKTVGKPLILFFDQFEQVFVHRYKFPDVYEQFSDSLKQWYEQDKIDVKILMCLRSDLFYFQSEIQNKLNYPLYSSNSFELKKFSAEEATNILEMIAKIEKIEFERDYIKYLFETNFMGKDHLISPVDLQILSLVISSQKISEQRAFKKTALQKIGEVEGLLYQYLEERLKLREKSTATSQTEKLMKVLLEFVDGNELTRSGAFTIKELQENLNPIAPQEIKEAINWLALERLITPIQQEEETAYELAHEKMIPAVMKLSGKILPKAYKANELLNKKVRVWMENNYSSRYLLGIRELWFIESHKRYLIWGNKEQQKQRFLQQSKRRLYRNLGILGTILLLLMTGWGWLHHTTSGQIWQIRRELAYWGEQVRNDNYQSKAAIAFAKDGQIKEMKALLDEIYSFDYKASALTALAEASSELSDSTEVVTVLKQALTVAQQIDSSYDKARALTAIAQAYIKLSDSTEVVTVLKQALTVAQQINSSHHKADTLTAIAQAYIEISNSTEVVILLKQALTVAQQIDDEVFHSRGLNYKVRVLGAIAEASSELSDSTEAVTLLKQALTVAQQIDFSHYKAEVLTAIAEAYIKLSDSTEAVTVLKQALTVVQQTDYSYDKAWTLRVIAEASIKLSDSTEAVTVLKQALTVAQQIDSSSSKAGALTAIAEASSELSDSTEAVTVLKQALTVAQQIDSSSSKAGALTAIAQAYIKLSDSTKAITLLKEALTVAQQIDSSYSKAEVLTAIAEAYIKLSDSTEAVTLLKQALTVAQHIDSSSSSKADALTAIAEAYIKLSDSTEVAPLLKEVLTVTQQIDDSYSKADALTAIALTHIKLSDSKKAVVILKQALNLAQAQQRYYEDWNKRNKSNNGSQIAFIGKDSVLGEIASVSSELSDKTEAVTLLKEVLTVAQQIDESKDKAIELNAIAEVQAKRQWWGDALDTTKQCPSYDCRVESLSKVLTVYAELKNPELKEEE